MRTYIYIDDSGTPGYISKSKYDTVDRKTWVCLILKPEEQIEAQSQMLSCIDELKSTFGINEFHFTDIYSGTKKFKGIDLQIRLNIFRAFAEIHRITQYPMLIQTFTSDDILRNRIIVDGKKVKADNFNLKDTSDFALFFLLVRIKQLFSKNPDYSKPVEIIIDEGRQKKDTAQSCSLLDGILFNDKLYYRSSSDEPLLQLVDFVAFTMNKVRWILTNNKKGALDIEFLKIAERANFNILNIIKSPVKINSDFVEEYDSLLKKTYHKNDNLSDIELEELKNELLKIKNK